MAAPTRTAPAVDPIHVPALAWLAVAAGLAVLAVVLQENGALLAHSWELLHEVVHDGRHALGTPCH